MTIRAANLHDNVGYTPYEGRVVRGWPETVLSRGRVVIAQGALSVERGSGRYLARGTPGPLAVVRPGSAAMREFKALIQSR